MNGEGISGLGNSGFVGYSTNDIANSYTRLAESYGTFSKGLGSVVEQDIIKEMGKFFFGQEAVDAANGICKLMNESVAKDIIAAYSSLMNTIHDVAIDWARQTNNENTTGDYIGSLDQTGSLEQLPSNTYTVQFTEGTDVKLSKNGGIGIDDTAAETFLNGVGSIKEKLNGLIEETMKEVQACTPFLGGGQELATQTLFKALIDAVNGMIAFIIMGETSGLKNFTPDEDGFQGIKNELAKFKEKYVKIAKAKADATGESTTTTAS